MLDELLAVLLRQFHHILRNGLTANIVTQIVIIDLGVHIHQVHNPAESVLRADGQLNGQCIALETVIDHIQYIVEICAHNVHLIDIDHSRYMVLVSLTPYGLRLGLNATLGAQNGNGTVQHTQGTLHLYGEVHMPGGIDDIDSVLLPEASGSSGSNGNTALLLLRHPVHGCCTIVGLTDLMVNTRVIQDTLGGGGFTSINMRHDTNISCHFKRYFSRHNILLTN